MMLATVITVNEDSMSSIENVLTSGLLQGRSELLGRHWPVQNLFPVSVPWEPVWAYAVDARRAKAVAKRPESCILLI